MQKIGMQKEGVLHNNSQLKGRTVDDVIYAITDEQWQKNNL
ncbi:GNAT family protein [Pediococcus inopinatus]|nr:GNAT family protein [Pediococcus inopinatus]WPP10232.1 GNAT family protein [Pediococcus inopinatus]